MKILITGANGMVGRNLREHSEISKHHLLVPSRTELDLNDKGAVEEYVASEKPVLVIHAAGRVGGIQANLKNPVAFLVENIDINRNLIGACHRVGVKRLLNLGSSCMYPRNAANPLQESLVLQGELEPTNEGYALAKIMAQRLCSYIMKEDPSFQYKTFIPSNLYGRFDHFDLANSHLIPAVILKLHEAKKAGQNAVEIWGDGEARREFMYAGELADAIAMAIGNFDAMPALMNIGTGVDYSVNEYYAAAADVLGYTGKFEHDLSKPVGMKRKLVDTTVATKWGWQSKLSLREGLEKTYGYYLSLL